MNNLSRVLNNKGLMTRVSPRGQISRSSVRTFAMEDKTWGTRENAFESLDVKKHDEELLRKLREKNAKEQKVTPKAAEESPKDRERDRAPAYVTMTEFLEFRKDMVDRIRDLEDEVHSLRTKLYR